MSPGDALNSDSPRRAALWFYLAVAFAVMALIFAAPVLEQRPLLVAGWLLATHLAWLLSLAWGARGGFRWSALMFRASPAPRSGFAGSAWPLALFAVAIGVACVFAPVYFSDDSIRHIHDGFYLLQGVDVYSTPPEALPPFLDRLPNHPDVGTIYLPFTQLQAYAGAALHARYGFLGVYYALCCAAIFAIWHNLDGERERVPLLLFWLSPAFLIPLSARHADVQGLLFVVLALVLLRTPPSADRTRSQNADSRPVGTESVSSAPEGRRPWARILRAACAGLVLSAAAGLKPEGLIWAGTVGLYLVARRLFGRGSALAIGAFLLGGVLGAALQLAFARFVLFAEPEAWRSFMSTVALFTQWFAAYNPVLELREWLYPDVSRPALLAAYRREIFLLGTLWLFLPFFRGSSFSVPLRGPAVEDLRMFVGRLLVAALAASILSKGVWHPWYFLWLLPALWLTARRMAAVFLGGALPLFYLPVVYLRASGEWWMPIFYAAILIYTALFFGYQFFRVKRAIVERSAIQERAAGPL